MPHSILNRGLPMAAAIVLVLWGGVAPAQSLADVIPSTCLLYFRDEDPVGRFEKLAGSGEVWKDPKRTGDRTKRSMDKAFKRGDKALEREEGTLDGWLRSVGAVEVALFSLSLDFGSGDMPTLDYAASFESPAAVEMFNTFGKLLVDQGQATKNERGDYVLGFGPDMTAHLSVQGNRVIMASSEDRMSSIVNALKSGMPSPLSADPTFRACTGEGSSTTILFARFGPLMQLIRDNVPGRVQTEMTQVINSLGLAKITGIGYHEEGSNGIIIAKSTEPVPAFKLMKGKAGPPGIMEKMPADCAFAIGRTDEIGPHLARIQKYLIDPVTFPYSAEVKGGLEKIKSATGVEVEQLLGSLKGGTVVAGVPDESGKFNEEESIVVVAKVGTRDDALALLGQLSKGAAGTGTEMVQTEEDGKIWLRPSKASSQPVDAPESQPADPTDSRAARIAARRARRLERERTRPKPLAVWTGELMVVGLEGPVNRTLLAQAGQAPTLGSTGAFKRLPPQATFYITSSLRSMFAQENDFAAALSFLKDFGNTGTSVVVEDDMMIAVSNRSTSEQISTVLVAAAMDDDGSDARREILDVLTEIGTRTKAYREKNNKWPASLTDLGYTAKDMPSAKDMDGKAHAIVFLPPKGDAATGDGRTLLAYFPSADFGRLCVSLDGNAWRWSESDFLTALQKYNSPK